MSDLIGSKISTSSIISENINNIVTEIQTLSKSITQVRPPNEAMSDNFQQLISELGDNRGRPLFYHYVGSGAGNGAFVELEDGSVKLDLINGIGINILGHSNPDVLAATMEGAAQDVVVQGNLQPSKEMIYLSRKLVELAKRNSRLNHSWLTTSGSMANENALKMCRQKTNAARKLIAMDAAFAGRSTMMAEVTDNDTMRVGLPRYNEVLRIPFYDADNPNSIQDSLAALKKHITDNPKDICAFMFEPIQGEGGFKVAPREYFLPLLELCKEHNIPIWADEIQTFCRTGEFFAFESLNLGQYIDICTVAKTLQGAATLYTDELNPKPGLIAGTFAGSSAAMSAGLCILNYLDDKQHMGQGGIINTVHRKFTSMLNELKDGSCKGLIQDVGGQGLMVAMTPFDGSKEKMLSLLKVLYKNGLICFGCGRGPFRIRFLLPAILSDHEIACAKQVLESSLLEIA